MQVKKKGNNPKGRWKKGESGNPAGKKPGYQDFVTRATYLLDTLTVGEIIERVQAVRINPKDATAAEKQKYKQAMAMPGRDLVIIMKIADAFTSGGGDALDRLLDRIIGKPTQQLNVAAVIDQTTHTSQHFSVSEIESWIDGAAGGEPAENPAPPLLN